MRPASPNHADRTRSEALSTPSYDSALAGLHVCGTLNGAALRFADGEVVGHYRTLDEAQAARRSAEAAIDTLQRVGV